MGPYFALIILMLVILGICYGVDKLFKKLFRSKVQHVYGKSVRLNKKFASIGLIVALLGLAGVFSGYGTNWLLFGGGILLIVVGTCLVVYYMTFGIYYDDDSFILSTFGRKSVSYSFRDIRGQMLYTSAAGILIELHMRDGRTVQLQPGMKDVDSFMNQAFAGWLKLNDKTLEDCDFHNPEQSCWFPPVNP